MFWQRYSAAAESIVTDSHRCDMLTGSHNGRHRASAKRAERRIERLVGFVPAPVIVVQFRLRQER